jgi:hypothetical protein
MAPKLNLSRLTLIRHWKQEYYSPRPNKTRMRNLEYVLLKHNVKIVWRSGPPEFVEFG